MNSFELQLTAGLATYIQKYSYDPERRSFELILFHDPEAPRNFQMLRATEIESFENTPCNSGPELVEGIIGADQWRGEAGKLVTVFHTDCREITLVGGIITVEEMAPRQP